MKRLMFVLSAMMLPVLCVNAVRGQMEHHGSASMAGHEGMERKAGVPSRTLIIGWYDATPKTLTPEELKALPHVTVKVMNGHSHKLESYSGVPVKDVLALVANTAPKRAKGEPRFSPRMAVVIAGATDDFQVALTLCDTDPGCRSGQAIVADTQDGKPLLSDGAFKLILTEDRTPGRWVRNLNRLVLVDLGVLP